MGCMDSKQHATPSQTIAVQQDTSGDDANRTVEMLQKGLKAVKLNLVEQHRNKSMVAEIIKMLFNFVKSTLTTGQNKVEDFMGLAFIGLHVREKVVIEGVRDGWKIGSALHALTEPSELSRRRNVMDNFLSCAHKFKEIKDNMSSARNQGFLMDDEPEAREAYGEGYGGYGKARAEAVPDGASTAPPSYKELQAKMLSVLDPLCDMVDGLLNPHVEGRFLKITGKKSGYLEGMKNTLGIAATIVKVFEPVREADSGRGLQLLAVMGPESYGKSTLINHILYNGQHKDFMPATAGMGTQVICKIAAGPLETLQRASDEYPQTGDVRQMVEKLNADMMKKRKAKSQRGQSLGIKEMEMLRATVKFEPPYPVQFLDVPGTKEETIFHTRVALGLATTLVLVSGKVETLRTQLESGGDLEKLRDAVRGLGRPIPIQCLASYVVTEAEFNASKHIFKRTLQENFPTCKDMIQEPLYMNFILARDQAHREAMVESFYAAMATSEAQVMDPLERFGQIEVEVESFLKTLSQFFRQEMKDFLTAQISGPKGAALKVSYGASAVLKDVQSPKGLEGAFSPEKINSALQRVKLGKLGTFQHDGLSEVMDVANYVQWLLNQCRIHHMSWLKDSSEDFHIKTCGKAFSPLKDVAKNSDEKVFMLRLCQTFKYCNQGFRARDATNLAWWEQEYTSHIAPYLDGAALGCLLMGFHLVSTDTRNKVDFVGLLFPEKKKEMDQLNDVENGVTDALIQNLGAVKYDEWIDRVNAKLPNRELAFEELHQAIVEAGEQFVDIALATGFLDKAQGNTAMNALVDLTFVLMENVFIDLQEDTGGYQYTRFSKHLQQRASPGDLQDYKLIIQGEDRQAAYVACCEALRTMQETESVSAEWGAKFRNGTLHRDIESIQGMREMLGDKFNAGPERAIVLIPQDARRATMERSVMQGPAYPIASAALAVLDRKIECKADAKPGKEFPVYALGEIQRAGARVAIFMRRGDTASYDPLSQETALLEKLQSEPNLVTLFVLWTPSQPGTEWDTAHYRQRWKSAGMADSYLDVKLVPMSASFDCQQFIDGEVAAAIKGANAKASKSLGQIRAAERRMLLNFASEVEKYETDFASAQNNDAKKFHWRMVNVHHKKLDQEMQRVRAPGVTFDIPDAEFNKDNFKSETTDTLNQAKQEPGSDISTDPGSPGSTTGGSSEKKEGITFNELKCRSFNFHVLLGQCIQKSSRIAATVYDKAVTEILKDVGGQEFFMDGARILKELDHFCAEYEQDPDFEAEIHRLGLLKLLITKQSFQHMYVGCVSYKLMPALYATVLPPLLRGAGANEVPTDFFYKKHMQTAKAMLEDGSSRRRGAAA